MILKITFNFLMAFQLLKEPVLNAYQSFFFTTEGELLTLAALQLTLMWWCGGKRCGRCGGCGRCGWCRRCGGWRPEENIWWRRGTPPPPHSCMSMMMTPPPSGCRSNLRKQNNDLKDPLGQVRPGTKEEPLGSNQVCLSPSRQFSR